MANKTIHELSPASTMSGNYEFAVYDIDGSTTKKATADQILNTSDLLYADDSEEESEEVDFTTQDETQNPEIQTVTKLVGTDSWSLRFFKISQMFQNIRYLINKLGTTDISSIGNGTVTNALSTLNGKLTDSGWLSESGYSYCKIGSVCIILMTKNNLSITNGWNTLFTMPTGYRPNVVTDNAALLGSSVNVNGLFRISANGVVQVYNSSSSTQPSIWGTLIYFIP